MEHVFIMKDKLSITLISGGVISSLLILLENETTLKFLESLAPEWYGVTLAVIGLIVAIARKFDTIESDYEKAKLLSMIEVDSYLSGQDHEEKI